MGNFDDFLKRNNLKVKTIDTSRIGNRQQELPAGLVAAQKASGTQTRSETESATQPMGNFDRFLQRNGLTVKTMDTSRFQTAPQDIPSGLKASMDAKNAPQLKTPNLLHPAATISNPAIVRDVAKIEHGVQQAQARESLRAQKALAAEFNGSVDQIISKIQEGASGQSMTLEDALSAKDTVSAMRNKISATKNKYGSDRFASSYLDSLDAALGDAQAYLDNRIESRNTLDVEQAARIINALYNATHSEAEDRTWLNGGAFEDGYDFGDLAKTLTGTANDIKENLYSGAMGVVEGAVDAGAYVAGGVGKLFGADGFADKTRDFIKKDLINEDKVAHTMNMITGGVLPNLIQGPDKTDDLSLLGERSDGVVQSVGQLAAQLYLKKTGVPWYVTTGVTSFGGEAENAFQQGATYGEAGISGAVSAGAEILSEKLFGGSGLEEKGLINTEKLTEALSGKLVKVLLDYGIDVVGEGAEEVFSQFVSNLGSAIYKDKSLVNILFDEEAIDGYIESFVGGMFIGGASNAGNAVSSAKTGRDYHTGLTADETAAFNEEYEKQLGEAAKDGKKLSGKEKRTIYDAVMKELKGGKLSTSSITPDNPTDSTEPETKSPVSAPSTNPINMDDVIDETIAQLTGAPADPVSAALDTVKAGGTVSNNQARDILNSTRAIQYLQEKTGMKLTDDRSGGTASSRRAAVKEAVAQLAAMETETVDTAPESGYDNQNTTGGNAYADAKTAIRPLYSDRVQWIAKGDSQGETARSGADSRRHESVSREGRVLQRAGGAAIHPADSEGRSLTPEQHSALQGTAIVDENNSPIPVYHATNNTDFTTFSEGDVGFHFGSHEQAQTHIQKRGYTSGRVFRAYLNIKNPVRTKRDIMGWQPAGTALCLWGEGVLTDAEHQEIMSLIAQGRGYNSPAAVRLREMLESKGYDGIVYANGFEGEGDSYIAFHDSQIIRSDVTSFGQEATTPTTSVGAAPVDFSGKAVYNDLLREGNVQPDRPGDVRPMEVPKTDAYGRRVSETAANLYGAEITPDDAASQIESLIAEGALGFDVKTNRQMLSDAAAEIKKDGLAKSEHNVTKAVFIGKAKDSDIAKAMLLYATYANRTSSSAQDKAAELMVDLATMANDAGRRLQLFSLLRKLTPEGQLKTVEKGVQRAVDNINKHRGKNNQAEVTIPQELVDDYLDAAKKDAEEKTDDTAKAKEDAEKAIYKAAAAQIDASPMEKLNAWRYMAMLGNIKTQARNFIGNAAFRPMVSIKRTVGAVLEAAFVEKDKRTKSILGIGSDSRALVAWAKEDAKTQTAEEMLSYCAQTGDSVRTEIDENRKIFDTKWLESVREFVQKVPEGADMIFKHWEYSRSLASFVKARGYTAEDVSTGAVPQDVLTAARTYAAQEALKATFNDHNAVSDFLSKRYQGDNAFGKAMNVLAEGVLPFRRTPANILVRSVEYSPLRLLKSATYDIAKVRSGDMTGAQYIDGLASGITGTAAMVLGYALCSGIFGIRLRGKVDDEDELRQGHQAYALEIGGKSYTIDWLAPTNIPLFVGANLYESTHGQTDAGWFASAVDAVGSSFEPMLELSCLSSLSDTLESVKYVGDGEPLWTIAATAATSYLNQYIPTLFGQVEQATESSKQGVYSDADTALGRFAEKTIGKFTQRIPGVDLFQAKKYDAWGRPVETSSWFESLVSPTYVSDITDDPVDNEISRLNKAQDKNVSPSLPSKTLTINSEEIRLSDDQYETLCRVQGQHQVRLVEDIMNLEEYEGLTDDQKAKLISEAYDYARELSKSSIDIDGKIPAYIRDRPDGMSEAEAILRQTVAGTTTKYTDVPIDTAAVVAELMQGIEPEGEYKSVRDIQKMEAVVESDELDAYVEKLLPMYMEQSTRQRYQNALDEGYSSDEFVAAYRLYLDRDKELSKTRQITELAEELDMDYRTAKTLWEIYSEKPD